MTEDTSKTWDGHGSTASLESQNVAAATTTTIDAELERATLASRETKMVARMECTLFALLLIASTLVSWGVYAYSKSSQERNFEQSFVADATKLLDAFSTAVERQIEAVDALSVAITSHARATRQVFPFVTLPDYGVRFANARTLSGSFMVGYYPIVTDAERFKWEDYVVHKRDTINDAYLVESAMRKEQDKYFNVSDESEMFQWRESSDEIVELDSDGFIAVAKPGSGPYLPVWQLSPVPPDKSLLNFNTLTHPSFAGSNLKAITTGRAAIDVATNIDTMSEEGTGAFYTLLLSLSQYRKGKHEIQGDPASAFAYPVFDSFDIAKRRVVGVVSTNIYWRLFFKNVLPPDKRGILCVLENSQNQTFTYRVDHTVSYLGQGDLHDGVYDSFEKSIDIATATSAAESLESKSFTSVALDTQFCNYKLRVYPSHETKDRYVTRDPVRAVVVVVCVFIFTSLIFVLYTLAVGRRQRIVMERAVASGAIVSSLFPSQVRDQLYEANKMEARPKHLLRAKGRDDLEEESYSRPIANLFECTTIMFADIEGFTSWSSSRQPVQVFELLETLYSGFDAIALRRKVFKVETIGDCYVAATGLPEPQEDHAVIMAKFADDCIAQMEELIAGLTLSLGADTAKLALRVGLHSGSVTGGVLRGQKSRFQLFGDSMNTASRMESNGVAGRIHVSQETAKELIAKGKSKWVTTRDDKIVAKGKGLMQTYWVRIGTPSSSAESTRILNELDESIHSEYFA
jgi:class 3 adenylate cyclase